MCKAREKDQILFSGSEINSRTSIQYHFADRQALRLLLELLRTRGITYRWRFPFCLHSILGSASLRMPEDLQDFCETLEIPMVDLPEWYSAFSTTDQRGRKRRSQAASTHPRHREERGSPRPSLQWLLQRTLLASSSFLFLQGTITAFRLSFPYLTCPQSQWDSHEHL